MYKKKKQKKIAVDMIDPIRFAFSFSPHFTCAQLYLKAKEIKCMDNVNKCA